MSASPDPSHQMPTDQFCIQINQWMAALSMGMGGGDGAGQLVAATLVCMALGFMNYAAHAYAFSLSGFMAGYQRLRRWIDGAVAALFAAAGLGLLRSALSR